MLDSLSSPSPSPSLPYLLLLLLLLSWDFILQVFRLLSGYEEKYLAAGLKLPVVLQYTPHELGVHCGALNIYVEERLAITVPIEA